MADELNDFFAKNPALTRVLADQLPKKTALPPKIAALQELHDRAVRIQTEADAVGEPVSWDEARQQAVDQARGEQRFAAFTEGLGDLGFQPKERRIPPEGEDS